MAESESSANVGEPPLLITKVFGVAREGNITKCSASVCFIILFVLLSALLIFDIFILEIIEPSDKLNDLKSVLDACGDTEVSDSNSFIVFEFIFRISERFLVSSLFIILLLRMKRIWLAAKDSFIGRGVINFSDQKKVFKFVRLLENFFMVAFFVNLFCLFIPVIGEKLNIKVIGRDDLDETILSEAIEGAPCDTFVLFGDDIFRMVYFFLFLLPLLYISRKLRLREGEASFTYSAGVLFNSLFLLATVIEVTRLDPAALIFVLPLYIIFLLEALIFNFCANKQVLVKTYKISDKYMLLFWSGRTIEAVDKTSRQLKYDSVSRLYRMRVNQYQMQLPYDLMTDFSAEYGTRTLMSFNNAANMFSLGLSETVIDEDKGMDDNLPFNRARLLEVGDGVLKLNQKFMKRSRKRQQQARKRNTTLMRQKTGLNAKPVTKRVATQRVTRASRNIGGNIQSSMVEVDLTNADEEQEDQIVSGTRDDDIFEDDPDAVLSDVPLTQEFDHAVILKLEPIWDENGGRTSRIPKTFGEIATMEQLNDFTNPVRTTMFANFAAGEIDYHLQNEEDVICFGSGGGAMFLLDVMRYIVHQELGSCRVHLIFSTADIELLQWFTESIDDIYYSSHRELSNIKIIAALTDGDVSGNNVARIRPSSAFGGFNNSYAAQRGSEYEHEEFEKPEKGFQIPKGAKKIIDKLQKREIKQNKETPLELNRQSTASSTKVSSIRFRWGKVILGRMNVLEKVQRLAKLNFECSVVYQGGSQELESDIRKSCKEVGFKYIGLNSFEALQSMSPETPQMMRLVTALESMAQVGSYAANTRVRSKVMNSTYTADSGGGLLFQSRQSRQSRSVRESLNRPPTVTL